MGLDKEKLAELLARARAKLEAQKEAAKVATVDAIVADVAKADDVDMSKMGITNASLETDAGQDAAMDAIRDVIDNITPSAPSSSETIAPTLESAPTDLIQDAVTKVYGVAKAVTLNEKQELMSSTVLKGESCVMLGAAGTGKTTATGVVTKRMMDEEHVKPLREGTKWLQAGVPGITVLSYTRKAVNNIRHAVDERIKVHTLTLHKILEFAPVWYEIEDPAKPGIWKKTMRFEPTRTRANPLPPDLKMVVIEESSMVGTDLKDMFNDAMPHKFQELYIGDIQQLPPIFGLAILGFKMLELPVIELTEVYRQALESPIIALAWKILEGNPHVFSKKQESYKAYSKVLGKEVTRFRCPAIEAFNQKTDAGEVKFQLWQKTLSSDNGLNTCVKQFNAWADSGYFNAAEDVILCPYNKAFGTIEINKGISQHLGILRQATVFEVTAGYNKHYLAVGDRVLYDKEDAFITDIAINSEYLGKRPQAASVHLDRWGHLQEKLSDAEKLEAEASEDEGINLAAIEKYLASGAGTGEEEDRVTAASHVVTVRLAYGDGEEIELDKASEINNLLGGYALTVHKAQGSEWQRVFFVMHNSHAVMNQRELLYTAVTRASKFLHIICEADTFEKGIKSQRIKGNTLAEKAEFFKGKQSEYQKKQKDLDLPAGEFKAGVYKGAVPTPEVVMPEPTKPPVKLVKMSEFVPKLFQKEALEALEKWWGRAKAVWGDSIGAAPYIFYDLQRARTLGVANAAGGYIKLNPVWCCLANANDVIRREMLHDTLGHEVAHIVATRFSGSRGHTDGWVMTMKLLGLPPDVTYDGDTLPSWTNSYTEILAKKKAELAARNADIDAVDEINPDEES